MLLHVCTDKEWKASETAAFYLPAAYSRDGFVHCCLASQLNGVLDRYFKGATGLWLLTIDERLLSSRLIFERGTEGDNFPHIYGPVNKSAIINKERLD